MDIEPCAQWMSPFAMALREAGAVELKFFSGVSSENTHNIQTHSVDLPLLVSTVMLTSANVSIITSAKHTAILPNHF